MRVSVSAAVVELGCYSVWARAKVGVFIAVHGGRVGREPRMGEREVAKGNGPTVSSLFFISREAKVKKNITCTSSSAARAQPSWEVKVDFPTPPFPLSTRIFRFTPASRSLIIGIVVGSWVVDLAWPDAQMSWFGHPSHASTLPARSDSVPGQWSGAFAGTSVGCCTESIWGGGWQIKVVIVVDSVQGDSSERK